ncbi:MAG: protein kinase domain-containing protein [Planctomycetota bacterium]|jgi:tRNA A-37 threonylcarbamoyl transferase component Bud32/tetratricopeptide (TPR) repeat protein
MGAIEPGSRFGDLEIERELGHGAYGVVYLAHDTLIGRPVALKVLRLPDAAPEHAERRRILEEARLIGKLTGPNIATLYRVHPLPGDEGWVFEMEYVGSGSLQDMLGLSRRLPPADATRIVQGVLTGLQEAHGRGIVHGDVKPGNVLLTRDRTVKLVDFGLARIVGDISLSHSDSLELIGTPLYMAPEVVMGEPPSIASDLWSTGVVLYRMLSGRVPFPGQTLPALFHAIENADPPPLDPALPPALVDLTMRCLAKPSGLRPASCAEALADLTPSAVAPPAETAPRPAPAPLLFGRDTACRSLREAARGVAEGTGKAVLLSGEAGMGKTALAHHTAAFTRRHNFVWIDARVTELEGLVRPLLTGLRDVLARRESSSQILESKLFGTATDLLRHLMEESIRIESRQQILWGIEQLFATLAEEQPVGILIEDAHLAHAEDRDLLREIVRRLRAARVLLLLTYRSLAAEGPALAKEKENALEDLAADEGSILHFPLGPLGPDAVEAALRSRAENARIAPEVLRHVLRVAEGNPLFTIELFRHLLETHAVEKEEDLVRPGAAWTRTTLPRRLRELVLLRLRGLPEDYRALLDVAAVDGVSFDGPALAAVLDRPLLDVLRALQEVYRRSGLVVPRAQGFRFANAVLQEGTYEELAPDLRRVLHQRLAEYLETQPDVLPERLGMHWERTGQAERARPHLLQAARRALERQEQLRAIDFTRRAGLAPKQLDAALAAAHAELLLDVIGSYLDLGRIEEAETTFLRLREAAEQDATLAMQVLVRQAAMHYQSRGLVGVNEADVRRAAERLAPSVHQARAFYLLGQMAKYRGDLDEAEPNFRQADRIAVGCAAHGLHASALDQLGSVALRRGRWREAEALYADAVRICAVTGQRTNATVSDINRAFAAFHQGRIQGLPERLDGCIDILTGEGASRLAAHARIHQAHYRYALGDRRGAEDALADALPTLRRARYLMGLLPATIERAHMATVLGNLDLAEQTLAETRRLAELTEDHAQRSYAEAVTCHVACHRGDTPAAQRAAARAIEMASRPTDYPARTRVALWVAEAVVYGLPADPLPAAEALLRDPRLAAAPNDLPLHVCRGAAAHAAAEGDPDSLEAAAAALRGPGVGPRRAALRVLAALFLAEARLRRDHPAEARREAEEGLLGAAALGHVWLEAHLRRLLVERLSADDHAQPLALLVRKLGARLGSPDERHHFLQRWSSS